MAPTTAPSPPLSAVPLADDATPLDLFGARDLVAHRGKVQSVAWSCSGHRLASAADDGSVKVWAIEHRAAPSKGPERPLLDLRAPPPAKPPPGGRPRGVRLARVAWDPSHPDRLAAVGDDKPLRLWDARGGVVRATLPTGVPDGHFNISLAWCAGGGKAATVAVGHDGDGVALLDLGAPPGSPPFLTLPRPGHEVNELAFTPDGRLLARAAGNGTVELIAWREGPAVVASLRGHTSTVFAVGAHPSSPILASGGADGAAVTWDLRALAPLSSHGALDYPIKSVSFGGPGGSLLACGGDQAALSVDAWESGGAVPPFLVSLRAPVSQLAWCPASSPPAVLAFTGPVYPGPAREELGAVGVLCPP
jgi:THO complex subunit 3